MPQILLPYPSFDHSVRAMTDDHLRRLLRDLNAVIVAVTCKNAGLPRDLYECQAVRDWDGCQSALGVYATIALAELGRRGRDSMRMSPPYGCDWERRSGFSEKFEQRGREARLPCWYGDVKIHSAHRAALLAQEPNHYGVYGWPETTA